MTNFSNFRSAVNKVKKVKAFEGTLLALDPGETTGWASFSSADTKCEMTNQGQINTWPQSNMVEQLTKLLDEVKPTHVVYEIYAIYEWKAEDHSWSQVPTLHVIGCVETLCIQRGITFSSQTAQIAKNFCTDDKLHTWDYYIKGQRHARDAIRHGCYFLMFNSNL